MARRRGCRTRGHAGGGGRTTWGGEMGQKADWVRERQHSEARVVQTRRVLGTASESGFREDNEGV